MSEKKADIVAALSAKRANSATSERDPLGILPTGGLQGVDLTAGSIVAVLLRCSVLDGAPVWVVADADTLADYPTIERSGLPVFFFDELEGLRGKTPAELKAIGLVKGTFPTGRVLQ